jgi:hypothetical protein
MNAIKIYGRNQLHANCEITVTSGDSSKGSMLDL